jgi:hypothetical protein
MHIIATKEVKKHIQKQLLIYLLKISNNNLTSLYNKILLKEINDTTLPNSSSKR